MPGDTETNQTLCAVGGEGERNVGANSERRLPVNRGLEKTRVATREESGVLGFPSRRGLTPRGSLECNPEIPAFPGEEY